MELTQKDIFKRTALLMGDTAMSALYSCKVIIFGVGGVGSWCAEGLVRSGISHLTIVDSDVVCASNINRQLMATTVTVGEVKVDALKKRLLEINPEAEINAVHKVYNEETAPEFDLNDYDYVIDAVDSLSNKILLILNATASKATFFCSLGAALKIDPTKIKVADFWNIRGCPLGAAIRKKMHRSKTIPSRSFLCVYDDEVLMNNGDVETEGMESVNGTKARINGTTAHVTAIFGMTLSGLVIEDVYKRAIG